MSNSKSDVGTCAHSSRKRLRKREQRRREMLKNESRKRLSLEMLESRQLMAADISEVVFVDPHVPHYATLIDQLPPLRNQPGAQREIVVLDADSDGVEQITGWLAQHAQLNAIHIVSHGDVGAIQLGNVRLDVEGLDRQSGLLAAWGDALTPDGDLLLYGCDVGQSAQGDRFLGQLATITGADVAASTNTTGAASLGGDWVLEKSTGQIDVALLFISEPSWQGLLSVQSFSDSWGTLTRSSGDGTTLDFSAVTGDLVFTINGDTLLVAYADAQRTDLLTYHADGLNYSIVGSRASDQFLALDDRQLTSIDGRAGDDTIRFDMTTGVTRSGVTTTATRNDNSTLRSRVPRG